MRNMKKILAMCLAGAMVFSMTACGGGSSKDSSNTGGETQSSTADAGTAADTGSEDAGTVAEAGSEAASDGERTKLVISCYLADDNQVAVREKYIDERVKEAFPDVDIEIKMYADRQSLQVEVAGGAGPDIMDLDGPTDLSLIHI